MLQLHSIYGDLHDPQRLPINVLQKQDKIQAYRPHRFHIRRYRARESNVSAYLDPSDPCFMFAAVADEEHAVRKR